MNSEKWFAIYSALADSKHGHYIYERENGEQVKCTCVSKTDSDFGTYNWRDKEKRGIVVRFVKSNVIPGPYYDMKHYE